MEKNPHNKNKNLKENIELEGIIKKVGEIGYYPAPLFGLRRKTFRLKLIERQINLGEVSEIEGLARISEIERNE